MTICIAAICDMGRTMVLIADKEVGIGYTSTELADGKWMPLFKDWSVAIADSVHNATDVIGKCYSLGKSETEFTVDKVRDITERAYRETRLARAEGQFLANRGWSLADFIANGSSKLPITTYSSLDSQIANFDLRAELIVAGFGKDDRGPSIVTVKNPGITTDHSKIGFWCIGSGSTAAQMSLFSRQYSWSFSPETAAFYVLEAKINAERATGVGDTTNLFLVKRGVQPVQVQDSTLKQMRLVYERLKPGDFSASDRNTLAQESEFQMIATAC